MAAAVGLKERKVVFYRFPPPQLPSQAGQQVFVSPKGKTEWESARNWTISSLDGDARCLCVSKCGKTKSVRRTRLTTIYPRLPREVTVIATSDTQRFRTLANSQVRQGDKVVELGCSTGETSWRLARAVNMQNSSGAYIGLDNSEEMVSAARSTYPGLQFEQIDGLMEKAHLLALCNDTDVVFIDIGGDRSKHTVTLLLALLLEKTETRLKLVAVKCETLVADMDAWNPGYSDSGKIWNAEAWFANAIDNAKQASKNWGKKKDQRKIRHPLNHQRKLAPNGIEICRFHQFGTCLKMQRNQGPSISAPPSSCPYEHRFCYECLGEGHRALECIAFAVPIPEAAFTCDKSAIILDNNNRRA